ncbi:MAG TPA: UbiA family prenyltransferase [Chitinophagaceae bacterium]
MLQRSTLILLRVPFSFFLMPVFFFALSQVQDIHWGKAALIFLILHFILYPSSNGYNSYMDRDEASIGLLEKPPRPTKELFKLTMALDMLAILLSFIVNSVFAACIIANIGASHAYSYRGIRLKQYPVTGFLTVILFQGALTYFMVYQGANAAYTEVPWTGMLISTLLFGGFYPLTQIYQHQQDLADGVQTISYKLGVRGTFIFSGCMYLLAEALLFFYFSKGEVNQFYLLQLFFIPVIVYFTVWLRKVWKNPGNADFRHAMRMNGIAALSMNAAFILMLAMNHIEK